MRSGLIAVEKVKVSRHAPAAGDNFNGALVVGPILKEKIFKDGPIQICQSGQPRSLLQFIGAPRFATILRKSIRKKAS